MPAMRRNFVHAHGKRASEKRGAPKTLARHGSKGGGYRAGCRNAFRRARTPPCSGRYIFSAAGPDGDFRDAFQYSISAPFCQSAAHQYPRRFCRSKCRSAASCGRTVSPRAICAAVRNPKPHGTPPCLPPSSEKQKLCASGPQTTAGCHRISMASPKLKKR